MDAGRFESVASPYSFHTSMRSMLVPLKLAAETRGLELVVDLDKRVDWVRETYRSSSKNSDRMPTGCTQSSVRSPRRPHGVNTSTALRGRRRRRTSRWRRDAITASRHESRKQRDKVHAGWWSNNDRHQTAISPVLGRVASVHRWWRDVDHVVAERAQSHDRSNRGSRYRSRYTATRSARPEGRSARAAATAMYLTLRSSSRRTFRRTSASSKGAKAQAWALRWCGTSSSSAADGSACTVGPGTAAAFGSNCR